MIERIMKQQRETYIINLKENITGMRELLNTFAQNSSADRLEDFKRYFHTLKGTARVLRIKRLGEIGARYDSLLTRLGEIGADADEYVKVLDEGFTSVKKELDRYGGSREAYGQAAADGHAGGEDFLQGAVITEKPGKETNEGFQNAKKQS